MEGMAAIKCTDGQWNLTCEQIIKLAVTEGHELRASGFLFLRSNWIKRLDLRIVLNLCLIKLNVYIYFLILIFEDLKFNLVQIEICKYINSILIISV